MARMFEPLNFVVPLRTTWEESWELLQAEDGPAVDLTGYGARMSLREVVEEGVSAPAPVVYTTAGADPQLTITPLAGLVALKVSAEAVKSLSPNNAARRYRWDVELFVAAGAEPEYVVPLFAGTVRVTPRVNLL